MRKYSAIGVLLIFVFAGQGPACSAPPAWQPLAGPWESVRVLKYNPGDEAPPASAGWEPYELRAHVGRKSAGDYFWLRIELPPRPPGPVAVYFHDVNALIFARFNGQVVHRARDRASPGELSENISFDSGAMKAGSADGNRISRIEATGAWPVIRLDSALADPQSPNLLELFCYEPGGEPEGIMGGVYYGAPQDLQSRFLLGDLDALLFGVLFALAGLVLFGIGVARPEQRIIFAMGFFMTAAGLFCLSVSDVLAAIIGESLSFRRLETVTEAAFVTGIALVLDQLFGPGPLKIIRRCWQAFAVLTVLRCFVDLDGGFAMYVVLLAVVLLILVHVIHHTARGDIDARIFLIGFLLLGAASVNDLLKSLRILVDTIYISTWGFAAFGAAQIVILIRRFFRSQQELEDRAIELTRLNRAYERFVPRKFLEELGRANIVDVALGDQIEKTMTVLFSDIRDFAALSEGMSPRENFAFINDYLKKAGPVIRGHGGFIDKYIGDSIMALFPGEPDAALDAARELYTMLDDFNRERESVGRPPIGIGVGIHTGLLMLGTVGEVERMDGTVISDAVNLAARLEGQTRVLGADIIVSAATRDALIRPERYALEYLETVRVKGKSLEVPVYSLSRSEA